MNHSGMFSFTKEQVEYLMDKTGADDPYEAIDIFAVALRDERVDPNKLMAYLTRLMLKDGIK